MTIKLLIVDDSAIVRQVIQDLLSKCRDIEVIATASDPIFAMAKMKQVWPDVILLDIEMPRMDGLTFLRQIMATRPTPVVICSTLTQQGADITVEALAAGAVSFISKPQLGLRDFLQESSANLLGAIREASVARLHKSKTAQASPGMNHNRHLPAEKLNADVILAAPINQGHLPTTEKIVALGTSTGGTQALELVLSALPANCPGIVIVQHMPAEFTKSFANRLNSLCRIEVQEAMTNDRILPGRALIAPGGKHMLVKRSGAQYLVEVVDGPLVSRHRPSVDVLFRSIAKSAGKNAIGVIMTGMGDDGANGLKEMFDAGSETFAQDESSCVVFGMPKEAIARGGVGEIIALEKIPMVIQHYGK